jgi:hypothetical protein
MTRLALIFGISVLVTCAGPDSDTGGSGGTSAGGSPATGGTAAGGASAMGGRGGTTTVPLCRPAAPCPSGWYRYSDTVCSPPSLGSGPGCGSNGDGLCYEPCDPATGCSDARFPVCGAIIVFYGSDAGRQKNVCVSKEPVPACPSGTGGAGGDSQP